MNSNARATLNGSLISQKTKLQKIYSPIMCLNVMFSVLYLSLDTALQILACADMKSMMRNCRKERRKNTSKCNELLYFIFKEINQNRTDHI